MTTRGQAQLTFLCVISAGEGTGDHRRVVEIMQANGFAAEFLFIRRGWRKLGQLQSLTRAIRTFKGHYVYLEGTGVVAGFAAIFASLVAPNRVRYLVSAGDAVDTYMRNRFGWAAGMLARGYERALYRRAFAFIGWTPYHVGRAYRMGARRGVTIEGFVPSSFDTAKRAISRAQLGIPDDALVVGVTGSLNWSPRQNYCYGMELVNAAPRVGRRDVRFLVIGGGTGLARVSGGAQGDERFVITGPVPHEEMAAFLALIDVAVIAQTPDELGALRLTTKLPEYLAAGVPVVMPAMPGPIDYLYSGPDSPLFVLPSGHPASTAFAAALASWIDEIDRDVLLATATRAHEIAAERFDAVRCASRLRVLLEAEGVAITRRARSTPTR